MSSAITPDLQDRVQTITDALVAFDEDRAEPAFDLDTEDVTAQLERLCAYRVPADEAVRTLVRKACTDAERRFLQDVIAGINGELEGYDLTQSMTRIRDAREGEIDDRLLENFSRSLLMKYRS